MPPDANPEVRSAPTEHPAGCLRLGSDIESNTPVDLELPAELATSIFLAGASGSGKTTTLARLGDGVIVNGYGVIIVDCKGGDLGPSARMLAERHGLPFHLVDPDEPDSMGYNPCSGDAASVANKLVGAFSYGPNAEIYKHIAMEAIPVIVRGLIEAEEPVTLDALYDACGHRGMVKIAHKIPEGQNDRLRKRLLSLSDDRDTKVGTSGYKGLQYRLGALIEGKFGDLFHSSNTLDWDRELGSPSVTYIALSTLASSEDVELMGRVIAQDLKQVCSHRIKARTRGGDVIPILAIFDEFAALREAEQLADLLLQAREARMPIVVSTQFLPETTALRKACLGAGLLIVHRVESEDANAIAAQFGTRRTTELTSQVDFETGYAMKGSFRKVDVYNVHPNALRTFPTGEAALRSVRRDRPMLVRIYPG